MAIKDRIDKLELKSRPLMVSSWFKSAIENPASDRHLLKCLHMLCEQGVLLKPAPPVWKQYEALMDLSDLSDEEVLRMVNDIDPAENAACWCMLTYEAFQQTPREVHTHDAGAKFYDCLRGMLEVVCADALHWSSQTIERAMKDADTAMEQKCDPTEKDAVDFFRSYQP